MSHGVVNDCDGGGNVAIVLGEVAAFKQRYPEGGEIIEVNGIHYGGDGVQFRQLFAAFDNNADLLASPQRQIGGVGDGDNAGHASDALARGFIKLLGARAVVAGLTGIEHEKREVSGLESGIDGVLLLDAAEEETSNHEQD